MGKNPECKILFTPKAKVEFLKKAQAKATDADPVWIDLLDSERLPWEHRDRVCPQYGIFGGLVSGRGRKITGVMVDFTRTGGFEAGNPFLLFPLAALRIKGDGIVIDCVKAMKLGVMPELNFTAAIIRMEKCPPLDQFNHDRYLFEQRRRGLHP